MVWFFISNEVFLFFSYFFKAYEYLWQIILRANDPVYRFGINFWVDVFSKILARSHNAVAFSSFVVDKWYFFIITNNYFKL